MYALTDSTGGANAEEDEVDAAGMMQQFDELMEHDGDGRDAHTMLQKQWGEVNNLRLTELQESSARQVGWRRSLRPGVVKRRLVVHALPNE